MLSVINLTRALSTSGRKLNKTLIKRLAECDYIADYHNIFITGATDSGKNYMACALSMEACKHYCNTKYVRLPDFLDLKTARENNCYKKTMAKYATPILFILDEWLLMKPTDAEQKDIFELHHRRRKKSSTIFYSQYKQEGWYEQLGDASPLADAILDRIVHDSYIIDIVPIDPSKDLSIWEVYGLKESDCM